MERVTLVASRAIIGAADRSVRCLPYVRHLSETAINTDLTVQELQDAARPVNRGILEVDLSNGKLHSLGDIVLLRAQVLRGGSRIFPQPGRSVVGPPGDPHLLLALMQSLAVATAHFPNANEADATFKRFNDVPQGLPEDPHIALDGAINIGRSAFQEAT